MGLMCTQPGGGCFASIVGFGIFISGVIELFDCSVASRGFMCWMILVIVRPTHYHDSVPRLGRLKDILVVVHMSDSVHLCNRILSTLNGSGRLGVPHRRNMDYC